MPQTSNYERKQASRIKPAWGNAATWSSANWWLQTFAVIRYSVLQGVEWLKPSNLSLLFLLSSFTFTSSTYWMTKTFCFGLHVKIWLQALHVSKKLICIDFLMFCGLSSGKKKKRPFCTPFQRKGLTCFHKKRQSSRRCINAINKELTNQRG